MGFAYNATPESVEYDKDGVVAPAVAHAQRRADIFPEAEAEAEAEAEPAVAHAHRRADIFSEAEPEAEVFGGLEDAEVMIPFAMIEWCNILHIESIYSIL